MKHLYLMRHCEPVPGHPMDGTRQLTDKGKKQAETMGKWLAGLIGRVDIVITSPFARAMETAEIMTKALGSHMADSRMLEPDGEPVEMWKEIERLAQQSEHVLVVGHDPSINALLSHLTTAAGVGGNDEVRFEHGAIACLKDDDPDKDWRLHWFVSPALVDTEDAEVAEAARALMDVL